MKFDAHEYTIRTRRVIDESGDVYFKATVAELPHLATYESSAQEAYDILIDDIEALHETAVALKQPFPQPQAEPDTTHSGRITLRLPKALHRLLDGQAQSEDASLNLHIVTLLAEAAMARSVADKVEKRILASVEQAIARTAAPRAYERRPRQDVSIAYRSRSEFEISENKEQSWIVRH